MNDITTVDARGLSCPEPAMLARQALKKAEKGTVVVLVDSGTALENVSRIGKNAGWAVNALQQSDGSHRIELRK